MSKLAVSEERKLAELVAKNVIWRCNQFRLFSEKDIADRIGMARSTFHIRRLDIASWKLIEITRAAVALGVSLEWLCTDHTKEQTISTERKEQTDGEQKTLSA